MAKLINIDSAELIRFKERLVDTADELNKTFVNLNTELGNVASNLVDKTNSGVSPLVEPMKNLMSRNDAIGSSIYMRIQEIALFIDGQVKEYNVSTEDAKASLVKLISLIQTSLGKNAGDSVTTTVDDPEIFGDTIGAGNGNSEPIAGSGVENLEEAPVGVNGDVSLEVSAGDTYKLSTPMASTYDESAYNEGVTDLEVALIQNRMGTVDALNDRMDVIVNSYNYYKELGYSDELIEGMLGNMCQESTFNLETVSSTGCKGLYQWTEGRAPDAWDLQSQLDRSVVEINTRTDMGGKTVWERLQNCSTVDEYTEYFAVFFEGAASRIGEVPDIGVRQDYAHAMYYLIKNNFNI